MIKCNGCTVLNGENVATMASVIFSILAGTASKHLYRDESSGDVDLPIPSQRFPSRTILTCAFDAINHIDDSDNPSDIHFQWDRISIFGVKKTCPCNHHQSDVATRFELHCGLVVNLHG
jgi:hypothetical protein